MKIQELLEKYKDKLWDGGYNQLVINKEARENYKGIIIESINEYNSAVLHLCEEFANKYFEQSDRNIIGNNNIGLGPLDVADHYFSIDDIVCALNNNITKKVLLKWYNTCLEDGKVEINLYNYYLKNK